MKKLALGLSLLLLSGCAAQRYEMPSQDVLTQSQIEERYSIDRQWWKQYADPKLDALVELALERNIDLARSAQGVYLRLFPILRGSEAGRLERWLFHGDSIIP